MQLLETFVKQKYGTAYAAAKALGTNPKQITRWIQYGCLIDDNLVVWKPQAKLFCTALEYSIEAGAEK
tara:strand:- start:254 stop:457 length:204 start_codon:yes stop_codon:yes gene_type:complete